MLYYIPFEYLVLKEPKTRKTKASLMLDLPQYTLAEAQKNLLVRDLVRHPYIQHCYTKDASYLQRPESLLKVYNGTPPINMHNIRVVYQRQQNSNNWQEMVLYISLDNAGETFLPFRQLEFVCGDVFFDYQAAFIADLLTSGSPMTLPQYEVGNLVKVSMGAVYELATVQKNNGQLVASLINNPSNTVPINQFTNSCIHGFNLTPELMRHLGASFTQANYNLGNWYELILNSSNSAVLHIIKRDYKYFLIIDRNTPPYYEEVDFLGFDGLQRLVKKEYGVNYVPTQTKLNVIQQYVNECNANTLLLMELPEFIRSLGQGTDVEIIIDKIMQQFQIDKEAASLYYYKYMCFS